MSQSKIGSSDDNKILLKMIVVILSVMVFMVLCSFIHTKITDKTETVESHIDGKKYNVRDQGDIKEKQEAANHLASISQKVQNLVDYMVENNLPNEEIAPRLKDRWMDCKFRETSAGEKSAAYTINKGAEMRLCVRNGQQTENMNTSMFVVLHELGHMMSVSYGHNDEFKENFSYIVHLASALGIYKPEDFENNPVDYCGTTINTTPCMSGTCEYTSIPVVGVEAFGNSRGFHFN